MDIPFRSRARRLAVSLPALVLLLGAPNPVRAGVTTGRDLFVAAAAHAVGGNGSFFATDLRVFNPGPGSASIVITWLAAARDNTTSPSVSATLAEGETKAFDDVVDSLFQATGAGGLRITADRPVGATSRTFNRTASGTFSQFIAARVPSEALVTGSRASLIQLDRSSSFRTNAGFLNLSAGAGSIHLFVRDSAGALLGETTVSLPPFGFYQIDPFVQAGVTAAVNARVDFRVDSGTILAYASVIDASTNDPNFIEPLATIPGDGTIAADTRVAADPTHSYRNYLEIRLAGGAIDQVVSWDQIYEGTRAGASTGCTGLAPLATVAGLAAPLGSDGSFTVALIGVQGSGTLAGRIEPDGAASGNFTIELTQGSCIGTFTGSWNGRWRP